MTPAATRPARRRRARRQRDDDGFATIEYVAAACFALVLFVLVANVLVDLYVRAAVREALDEAARAAVPASADATSCRRRADDALAQLARGPMGRGVQVTCQVTADWVRADAHVRLRSFVPWLMPAWTFDVHAVARREPT